MESFNPFANNSQSLSLGEFTVENQGEQLNLYGSMTLTLDKQSLDNAKALQAILTQAIAYMQKHQAGQQDKQAIIEQQQANVKMVKNPFG